VELSTNIHKTKIKAKSVILLIFSQAIRANTKTIQRVNGIETAVLKAFFAHKYKAKTAKTIKTDCTKLIKSIFVALLAFAHSFEITFISILFGNSFFTCSSFSKTS
jgi:hypothetical protein